MSKESKKPEKNLSNLPNLTNLLIFHKAQIKYLVGYYKNNNNKFEIHL